MACRATVLSCETLMIVCFPKRRRKGMHTPRIARVLIPSLVGCLVLLFAASALYTRADAYSGTFMRTLHPALSTSCPAPGTARAAVMPPMTLGSHANIVYI